MCLPQNDYMDFYKFKSKHIKVSIIYIHLPRNYHIDYYKDYWN